MLFETDVVFMNLEAGQKPKLTAKWDKRSLSHSQGSLLWQESRWLFVEITKPHQREGESEDAANFPLQLILLHRLPFSCYHLKIFWFKQKGKCTSMFFYSTCTTAVRAFGLAPHMYCSLNYTTTSLCLPLCVLGCVLALRCSDTLLNCGELHNDWVNSVIPMATLCASAYKRISVHVW